MSRRQTAKVEGCPIKCALIGKCHVHTLACSNMQNQRLGEFSLIQYSSNICRCNKCSIASMPAAARISTGQIDSADTEIMHWRTRRACGSLSGDAASTWQQLKVANHGGKYAQDTPRTTLEAAILAVVINIVAGHMVWSTCAAIQDQSIFFRYR